MRLPAWTSLLAPPAVTAVLVPLLLAVLAIAVPAASRPADQLAGGSVDRAAPPAGAVSDAAASATPVGAIAAPSLACSPVGRGAAGTVDGAEATARASAVLDRNGEMTGQRLSITTRSGRRIVVSLPTDSFVTEPTGGWLLYGLATLAGSEVRAIDLAGGCDTRLARLAGIARGALLAPSGDALVVHTVDAATRADSGVMRVDLAIGSAVAVAPPFTADDDFGPVFATELAWSADGATLAIQSCGAASCQTRLLDTATGEISVFAMAHGSLVGVTGDWLYAFEAGHDRPAALLAIARDGGAVNVVAPAVHEAELDGPASSPTLRYETPDGWQEQQP